MTGLQSRHLSADTAVVKGASKMHEVLDAGENPTADHDEPDLGYVKLVETPWRGHWLLQREVLSHTEPGDRVFEGGVSTGYLSRRFVDEGRRVDGAEIDPAAARQAEKVCERVWVCDLQSFDVDQLEGRYQVLLFGDTLEHLPDPPAFLRRIRSKLNESGVLVVSLPNVANWSMRLRLLLGRFDYTDRGILDRTHLRFYTKKTAAAMLESAGFEVTRIQATVPVPLFTKAPLSRLTYVVGNRWPALFAYTFVITARPAQP